MISFFKKPPALLSVMVCSIALLAGCQQRSADEAGASSGGSSTSGTESGRTPSSAGGSGGSGNSGGTSGDITSGASSALENAQSSDTAITSRVKAALLRDTKVRGTDINVETNQGEVVLSGFVDTPAQVDEAMKLARGIEGVKKVTNKMKPRQ